MLAATDHRSQNNACRATRAYRVSRITGGAHIIKHTFSHMKAMVHVGTIEAHISCYAFRYFIFTHFVKNEIYKNLKDGIHNEMSWQQTAQRAYDFCKNSGPNKPKGVLPNGL